MLHEFTASVRRWVGLPTVSNPPLTRLGESPAPAVLVPQTEIESLRGVSAAAADQQPCACPDACERDHANE